MHVVLSGFTAVEKLHGTWDADLVHLSFGHNKTDNTHLTSASLDLLAATASQTVPSLVDEEPPEWARGSNKLARTVAYSYTGFVCGKPLDTKVVLTKTYSTRAGRSSRRKSSWQQQGLPRC